EPPLDSSGVNHNTEPPNTSRDLPVNHTANGPFSSYARFTFEDRKHEFWVYRGPHRGLPPLQVGSYNSINNSFSPLPAASPVVQQQFAYYLHISRRLDSISVSVSNLPVGLALSFTGNGWAITGTPTIAGSNVCSITVSDSADDAIVTTNLTI